MFSLSSLQCYNKDDGKSVKIAGGRFTNGATKPKHHRSDIKVASDRKV